MQCLSPGLQRPLGISPLCGYTGNWPDSFLVLGVDILDNLSHLVKTQYLNLKSRSDFQGFYTCFLSPLLNSRVSLISTCLGSGAGTLLSFPESLLFLQLDPQIG